MSKVKSFFGKVWYVIKTVFSSLFSNQKAYDNARDKRWWWAVIIGVISVIFSLIPILSTNLSVVGENIFNNSSNTSSSLPKRTYSVDDAIADFVVTLNNKNIDIVIDEEDNQKIAKINGDWNTAFSQNKKSRYEFYTNNERRLEIYYTNDEGKDFDQYINNVYNNSDPVDGQFGIPKYTSFIIIGKKDFIICLFSNGTTIGNRRGDYSYLEKGYSFKNLILDQDGNQLDLNKQNSINIVFENFKQLINKIYEPTRLKTAWSTTGIISAINVGVTFLLGFLIWILTRGKTNPFRTITFWETQKISYWCALTPSILTLALGFLLSTYAVIMYVGFLGLRITFLSMKILKPSN